VDDHLALAGELERITEQIADNLADACDVTVDEARHSALDIVDDLDVVVFGGSVGQLKRLLNGGFNANGTMFELHLAGTDFGEV